MDRKGFIVRSKPDFIVNPPKTIVQQEVQREIDSEKTTPAPDARYNAYAAPMEDGRLLTDYRQACVTRAPPGTQFAVKQWTVHNTDEMIRISRLRQVQSSGHSLGSAATELPPAVVQQCTPEGCSIQQTHYKDGLGIERLDGTPDLFGTFQFSPGSVVQANNRTSLSLNKEIAYGRNTPTRWVNLYQ
jgi:hypothetical protein